MADNNQDKLTKAKSRLVIKQPFFAHVVLSLPMVEAPWLNPKTMATDMERIYWHPDFVEKHSVTELTAVLAHEAMHVAYLHGTRRGVRDPQIWNYACDLAINPVLIDAGFTLPQPDIKTGLGGPLYMDKYRNWSAQAIYADLEKNATKITIKFPSGDGKGDPEDGDGSGMWGGIMDPQGTDADGNANGKGLTQEQRDQIEQEVKIRVKQAADIAKSRGNLPAGLEGLIEAIGKPKVDWKNYIQQWVSGHTPDNYSWARPNRTMLVNHRVYMPRMQFNGAGVGVLSVDTSGSVSDQELRDYVREIAGVIELCSPDKLYIIQHDAIVQKVDEWNSGDAFDRLAIKGRGGTCIQPVFRHIETLDEKIDWAIMLTDMGIGDFGKAPNYPVLWCATGPDNAPYGVYIPLYDAVDRA